jgi:FxsC-like protein
MGYRFFFSYARENRDRDLDRFFKNLCTAIKLEEYVPKGELVFFDGESIETGAPWKDELGKGLRTSRALLAVCSPDYINSDYCGKEFQVFLERVASYKAANSLPIAPPLIIPVIWGNPSGSLREVVSELQYSDNDFPAVYAKEGLRYVMQLSKHKDDYKRFVKRLAQKIVRDGKAHPLPDLAALRPLDQVNSAWAAPGPQSGETPGDNAWFVFVAAKPNEFSYPRTAVERYRARGGRDWRPYHPDFQETIGILAQGAAAKYSLYFGEMPLNNDLVSRIEEAEKKGEIVIVLVDAWTLKVASYRDLMRRIDKVNFENCALMIPWNAPDPETEQYQADLRETLEKTFKFKSAFRKTLYYSDSIDSARELRARLLRIFAELTNKRIDTALPKNRIKDPQILKAAQAKGIAVLHKAPGVTSPGGSAP